MKELFYIFPNFSENILLSILFVSFILMYVSILVLQIIKYDKTIFISIILGVTLGVFFLISTSIMDVSETNTDLVASLGAWFTLVWNIFMIMLLTVLPLYIFSMVSTTFTNTRHEKHGKKLLITSFLSLWGMTLLGILVALLFIPIMILLKNVVELDSVVMPNDNKSALQVMLSYYSLIVLCSIILALLFAIVMNSLHKYKHDIGEGIISGIEKIKEVIRAYLNLVTKLVPYVISGMLIMIFDNYGGVFVNVVSTLSIFILLFFAGLGIVTGLEISIINIFRTNKEELPRKELKAKSKEYTTNVFAVQSAPILYPITMEYVETIGVSKGVAEAVPTLSTFMGYSMCGGFYPALIVIFTLVQPDSYLTGNATNYLLTISLMVPLIMIMTLGMTGVPGADVAIVLGLLSTLGLNPNYFFTIYLVEPLLDKFRGIGNSYGFAAASIITDKILSGEKEEYNYIEE